MKTYYTKCGRQFQKSSNASVTGYNIHEEDKQCDVCPFRIAVNEGWPPVFKKWECRAGAQPPNQMNSWRGSLEDKNTIHVHSLHHDFLEAVLKYCQETEDLGGQYNQDSDDCRRTISVSCSGNKKGIAAKKKFIELFFPTVNASLDQKIEDDECCENCVYGIDFGESVEYIKCQEGKHNKDVRKKQPACAKYVSVNAIYDETTEDQEDHRDELLEKCDQEDCPFNDGVGHCCFAEEEPDSDGYHRDVISAVDGYGCKNKVVLKAYKAITTETVKNQLCIECKFCRRNQNAIDHPLPYKCFRAAHRHGSDWYFTADSIVCSNFNPSSISCSTCKTDKTTCGAMYPSDYMYKDMKPCNMYTSQMMQKKYVDTKTGRLVFVRGGLGGEDFKAMYHDAGKWGSGGAHSVKSPDLPWRKTPEEAQTDLDAYAAKKGWKEHIEEKKEVDEVRIGSREKCEFKDEQCPYYCNHNEGCALKLSQGDVLVDMVSKLSQYNCDVYFDTKERCLGAEKSNDVHVDLINTNEAALAATFDYSTVDNDTATFLQEKEQKITQIRMMSVYAIGKELKEAQDKLADHNQGTFGKWCESLGFGKSSVYNYINAYSYVVQNLDNLEMANSIQPSLLFAISKPSAPKELQEKVLSGDITTHKQYREMEEKIKAIEGAAKTAIEASQKNRERADKAEARVKELDESLRKLTKAHAVSPAEVEKLKKELEEANRQVELLTDELMKPVEMEPAVVEKVPEEIEKELAELRKQTSLEQDYMYVSDILNMLRIAHHTRLRNWAKVIVNENSEIKVAEIRNELIDFGTKIESMIDYLDEEVLVK